MVSFNKGFHLGVFEFLSCFKKIHQDWDRKLLP
jgi:hypothetical protein